MLANMTSLSHIGELDNMNKEALVELMLEKDRRIQDLERLLEDQKRLRLQDSNQVEEKAAKIKEWVTNKLKELENQNKLLRDQNRKQKEAVESLSNKLATLSPISSPRKRNNSNNNNNHINNSSSLDRVQYIDQHSVPSSPIHTIDVNKSLKTRRPQLKKLSLHQSKSNSMSSDDNDPHQQQQQQQLSITLRSTSGPTHLHSNQTTCEIPNVNRNGGVSMISISDNKSGRANSGSPSKKNQRQQQDSPLYDTVNIELVNSIDQQPTTQHNIHNKISSIQIVNKQRPSISQLQQTNDQVNNDYNDDENHYDQFHYEEEPPPPPMHQFDRWESELYSLAEATFSSIMQPISHDTPEDSRTGSLRDATNSQVRKSSSSLRDDIISVIKPSFTTIDGDQVVDVDEDIGTREINDYLPSTDKSSDHKQQRCSTNLLSRTSSSSNSQNRSTDLSGTVEQNSAIYSPKSHDLMKQKSSDSQLFSSPMRSRSGKDSILRTQSVRRQPAPEKLYDFIATDLVKRGYLIKHGALRSHQRWFVLRNFHLYSYKRMSEETDHASPTLSLKLEPSFQVQVTNQSNDGQYPFKITPSAGGKSVMLIAESAQIRDEWCQILTVAINMSDIEPERLTKSNSAHEGMLAMTRHGHTKRCHAVLVKHVVFFLKSPIDPTPMSYISVKGAKIREVMDNYDYDLEEQESLKYNRQSESVGGDCSLAIYPRYSLNLDPVYLTLGSQQDTDEWFYHMSNASGLDQSSGTEFERILTQSMLDNTSVERHRKNSTNSLVDSLTRSSCLWREHSIMIYTDKPLCQPLTSLPNETLRVEATELFKSILLFTQVPIEPIAIDYHVCLLQNCLMRFFKYPELRNEFYAQLIKQSTYVVHCCGSRSKLSSIGSSGGSSGTQRSSDSSVSPTASECQFVTDLHSLESMSFSHRAKGNKCASMSRQHSQRGRSEALSPRHSNDDYDESNPPPPTRGELLQVMQIIAIAVSVNLPRGRLRWWLVQHLQKFANPSTEAGKYALYSLRAIDRTVANGCRDNIPSRTELLSILLRNPYDHSAPHSLPVSFADGSYHVIGADGSTTVEEFMLELGNSINIRPSPLSDFYLFADDPAKDSNTKDLHILEPQRKVLDVVGWWEQSFKQANIGRQQNTRVIKFICKKRLLLKVEESETEQERSLIMNQVNQEIVSHRIPLSDVLIVELAALMTQFTFDNYEKSSRDVGSLRRVREHILDNFIPANSEGDQNGPSERQQKHVGEVLDHWQKLSGRTAQDCVRVYLNCIRRLKLGKH